MKKIIFSSLMLFTIYASANNVKTVKSAVKKVTIFTQGAQIFRSASVTLNPGVTELVFSGISPFINPASLQAGGKGSIIVQDVKHNIKYPEPPKQTKTHRSVRRRGRQLLFESTTTSRQKGTTKRTATSISNYLLPLRTRQPCRIR